MFLICVYIWECLNYKNQALAENILLRVTKLIQKCNFASYYVLFLLGLTGFDYKFEVNRKHVEHCLLARKYQCTTF